MANIRFVDPLSQPTGAFRLLDWLNANFLSDEYGEFKCLVAFVKVKPFYKLHGSISAWNAKGKRSEAIFGVDHKGTSYQALQYAYSNFHEVHILHADYATFHPKLYVFKGENKATAYYGSSNFTSGGLETNFEGGTIIDFVFPQDQDLFDSLLKSYSSLLSPDVGCTKLLSAEFLQELKNSNLLMDETLRSQSASAVGRTVLSRGATGGSSVTRLFPHFSIKPAKAIPKEVMTIAAASAGIVLTPVSPKPVIRAGKPIKRTNGKASIQMTPLSNAPIIVPLVVDGFVIQVSPHHNGEIFLSKLGVDQNKPFFGFPFTGRTIPKKVGNPTYPQRDPDPVVNIRVFNAKGQLVHEELNYNLNTVYYEKKSEIRITITPSILAGLNIVDSGADYPILVMSNSKVSGCDYDMDFYAKGSPMYDSYLAICDQTLPSGGKAVARKMGWI